MPAGRRACLMPPRVPQLRPALPLSWPCLAHAYPVSSTNQPALAYTRLHSPALACPSARVSRHSRVPACHGHPSHESHASSCILMHCMYPHASACIHMSNPCSVRPTPIPSLSSRGPTIRPVHMPSGLVSWIVANPTQHPHPSRCVRPAAPQHPSIPPRIVFVQ